MKMILLTVLEKEHLLHILGEVKRYAEDMPDGWAVAELCEGGEEILANLESTEVVIPDG